MASAVSCGSTASQLSIMSDVVVPWCRQQQLEVTRSRAYKKNNQAFVEQKSGAVVFMNDVVVPW